MTGSLQDQPRDFRVIQVENGLLPCLFLRHGQAETILLRWAGGHDPELIEVLRNQTKLLLIAQKNTDRRLGLAMQCVVRLDRS